ncbi:MAG: phosphatidylserine/phosphatidylglycerophosphate/cardiolipin synthase-like enzyme [Myxococcota bacterium]
MIRALPLLLLFGCNPRPSAADMNQTRGSRLDVYFNDPGSRLENIWRSDAISIMVDMIDNATVSIDFAVMGFSHEAIVSAMIRAHDRGVALRMVGDAGHLYASGYRTMYERHVPMVTGNMTHIMHDKFMIVDERFVFAGTANWTPTDLEHNSNNFFAIDSPWVALDFKTEFEQMYAGAFGHQKVEIDNGRTYTIGDTEVEVWFSPNEDAMGRILELVDATEDSIRFTIFAFTKDQVGSAFIRKLEEFREKDAAAGRDPKATDFRKRRSVAGVIDQSQLHSNGQYHEVYRLLGAGADLRMDGIDSSKQPGDYQAGGGRLHSKTMILDADGENPVVITGSFNWSASATTSNDEFLMVFHGKRVAKLFDEYFESLWENGRQMGSTRIGQDGLEPGDIIINEVMWYGAHANDLDGFDEFIELKNLTNRAINLDLWSIANADDFVVGLPPGSTIPANGTFTIVDHTLEPYIDGAPQDENTAYLTGDLVLNAFNDNRQARLYLKDTALELILQDPAATMMDVAGDGGPPFAGGPDRDVIRSMERIGGTVDGTLPGAWKACVATEGTEWVNPDYRSLIRATPGAENSH